MFENKSGMNSTIIWPGHLKARRSMAYNNIDLLYKESRQEVFGDKLALILGCAVFSPVELDYQFGVVHKLELTAMPNISQAQLAITHEVCPGLKSPSCISPVNDAMKVVGFDSGSIAVVSNYGPIKTLSLDVRGRLEHHYGEMSCLAANRAGDKVAGGCTAGVISLYQTNETGLTFLSKTQETRAEHVTGMCFYSPSSGFQYGTTKNPQPSDDSLLLFSSSNGQISLIDTRCRLAEGVHSELMFLTQPRVNITAFTTMSGQLNNLIYLGTSTGEIIACDIRLRGKTVVRQKLDEDTSIGRLKEVVINSSSGQRRFLAYTNGSKSLKILDVNNLASHGNWICEREPGERIRDFVQIGDRLITCGDNTTIGCWTWDRPIKLGISEEDERI